MKTQKVIFEFLEVLQRRYGKNFDLLEDESLEFEAESLIRELQKWKVLKEGTVLKKERVLDTAWYVEAFRCPHCNETIMIITVGSVKVCPYCMKEINTLGFIGDLYDIKLKERRS